MKVTVVTTYNLDIERKDGLEVMCETKSIVDKMQQVLESKTTARERVKMFLNRLASNPEDRDLEQLSALFFAALDERHFSQARAHKTSFTVEE